MDGVPARQHCCGLGRVEEELKAHRTVLSHAVHHTNMVVLQQHQWQLVKPLHRPCDMLAGLRSGVSCTSEVSQSNEQREIVAVSSWADYERASGATDVQLPSDNGRQIHM